MEFLGEVAEWFSDPAHWSGASGVPARLLEHVWYSALSLAIAAIIAIPIGLYVGHTRKHELLVVSIANLWRAVPSFAVLGVAFILLLRAGLGFTIWPTVIAMVILAVPPILTNTAVAIQGIDPDTVEAARGMGMSEGQILLRVEVPLGRLLIVTGLRTAALQVVATATLAAEIAGGGLGRYIVDGFRSGTYDQVFAGALLVAALAILTEAAFGFAERGARQRSGSGATPRPLVPPAFQHPGQVPRGGGEVGSSGA